MDIFAADTETLGLQPAIHRVIELSFARVNEDDWDPFKIETFRFVPRPEHLASAHPKALEVNGYRDGHPDWRGCPEVGSPEATEIWRYALSRMRGARLLCQNVPFDRGMMWEELRLHGAYAVPVGVGPEDGPWERDFIEVRQSSSYLQKRHGFKSASLNPLYESCRTAFGAPQLPHQHRSESDVLRALWVWAHAAELQGDARVPWAQVKQAVLRWVTRLDLVNTEPLTKEPGVEMTSVVPTLPPPPAQPSSNYTPATVYAMPEGIGELGVPTFDLVESILPPTKID